MAPKLVFVVLCLMLTEVDGSTSVSVTESSTLSSMSSLEQCDMSHDMYMPSESMWMPSESMWMHSESMSMPPESMWVHSESMSMPPESMWMHSESMSMPPESMPMPSDYHDPSETYYVTDSEGNTICYFPPMTSYSNMPPMSSSSDMPPPPMSSSSDMPPPPMSSSSDMPPPSMSSSMPPPSMSSSSDMPPPSMSSSMPPHSMSSSMSPHSMSSSSDMAPPSMSSSSDMPPPSMSSSMPPPMMSSSMPPPTMSSSMPPPPLSSSSDMNQGIQSSMTSSESQTSSTTPPMMGSSSTQAPESSSSLMVQPTPSSSIEMSSSAAPSCPGVIDCAGVCDGPNVLDSDCNICYGPQGNYSKVSDFKDCNKTCFGTASINRCGFCSGGDTGKSDTEGVDSCNGMCKNDPKYINPVDCNGDCNGTAFIDASCTGLCMGGNTGIMTNHSRDCSNICNGTNEVDSCNFCTAPFNGPGGSMYKDCNDTCRTPATMKDGAILNKCGTCVGGDTGKALTFGIDVCGICDGNGTSCLDCEGTANGGKVNDACNVCGGDGTTCDVVVSISPTYAPSVTESTIDLLGAGFRATSTRTCYIKKSGGSNIEVTVASVVSSQKQVVTIPNTVTAGSYKIDCISGTDMSGATIDLIIYDSTGVSLTSISPTTFTKGATTDTEALTLTGTGFIQNSTYCIIVTGGSTETVIEATWTDATSATCTINHPAKSQAMTVYLSLNGRYRHQPSKVVTAQAAAPTATAAFAADNGAEITMAFSDPVDTSSFTDCSNIFNNASVTALGANAKCSPVSSTKLVISGSSLALSSSLTPKANVIKQAGEAEALPLNSPVAVTKPAKVASPVVNIIGPNEIGSCDSAISLLAVTSSGGVGRDITYSWSVNTAATIGSDSSQATDVTGIVSGANVFTLSVTNFFSESSTVTKTVTKRSVSLPKLFVSSTGKETILVSERFDLIANAKLIKGCADDTLTFSWSFSGGVIADSVQKNRQRYTVAPNSLPAGQTITATVTVALQSKPGDTIEGTTVFTTAYSPLDARIKGASTRTIGVDGGPITLDASSSVDPNNLGDMTYSWQCEQIENNVASGCLSSDGSPFPTSAVNTFTFNANKFLPDKQYRFTVTTQSGSRVDQASVMIFAIAGNPPKVEMSEIRDGGYVEKFDTVKIDALITLPSAGASIVSIEWVSVQDDGQGSVDLTNPNNLAIEGKQIDLGNNKVLGIISIKAGILEKGERYTIQSKITDNSNNVIVGSVDINVYTGVKSCQLEAISSYTAMAQVDVTVKKCMTDEKGGTLSYKLFIQTDNNGGRLALTDHLLTNTLTVPYGPKAYVGSTNVFIVQVCARKGGCMELTSDPVTVTSITPAQLAAAKTAVLAAVEDFKKTSDPLKGAVMVSVFLDSSVSTSSRRKRRSVTTDDIHTAILDLVEASLTGATKTQDRITTIMDVLCTISVGSVSDVDLAKAISNYNDTVSFLDDNSFAVSKKHAECFLGFNKNIKSRGLDGDFILPRITKSIAKGFIYGDVEVISVANEYHQKYSEEIPSSSYTTGSSSSPVQIDFGSTLTSQYGSWSCSSGTCAGVLIKSQHYATTLDPFSTAATDISNRASDVLSLDLLDPLNGDAITGVTNLAIPVTLKFPVTKPTTGATYKCKYWHVGSSAWKDDGVTTGTQTSSQVDCTSKHLTSFAVFKDDTTTDDPDDGPDNNLAAIIGGTIAGIIVLAFIVIVIVLIIKKKKDETKVHSRENLRDEEMVGS